MTRIFHPEELSHSKNIIGTEVALSAEASHHLCTVLRMIPGDPLVIFCNDGQDYHATLSHAHKKNSRVVVQQVTPNLTESPVYFHLVQGVCRGEKMDWIIQKAVELGVNEITPVISERTQGNKSLKDAELLAKKNQHYQQIIISACEQSGRSRVPLLNPTLKFEDFMTLAKNSLDKENAPSKIILSPPIANQSHFTLKNLPPTLSTRSTNEKPELIFIVGPEGGLTDQEILQAVEASYAPLSLGPRILRTETAALAFIAAIQGMIGDF